VTFARPFALSPETRPIGASPPRLSGESGAPGGSQQGWAACVARAAFLGRQAQKMKISGRNLWPIALFGLAVIILLVLIVSDSGKSRFDACMGIGAFSESECEAYARE
jgi:hypothetical protein